MIVEIDLDLLNQPDPAWHLDEVLSLIEGGRHLWWVPDPEAVRRSVWYLREGRDRRRRMDVLINGAERHRRPQVQISTATRPGRPWTLTPSDAARILRPSLRILVENAEADGRFVELLLFRVGERRVMRHLGRDRLAELKRNWVHGRGVPGWIEVEHGGGSTIAARIRAFAREELPSALFVLLDSDRAHPEGNHGKTAEKSLKAASACTRPDEAVLAGWRPETHVLKQREVENYIPDGALRARGGDRGLLDAVRALRPEQRSCFDHKKGLAAELRLKKGSAPDADPANWTWKELKVRDLYATLTDLRPLREGFGPEVWRSLLDDEQIHARALRERGGAELDELIERILTMI